MQQVQGRACRQSPAHVVSGTDAKVGYARQFAVHVGVDTGKSFHQLVARGPDGRRLAAVRVDVTRASFEAADEHLTATFPGVRRSQMLVGLEFAGHNGFTFAHFLAACGYGVVSVLPFVTKRLKDLEDNSPRKDDAKDAAQVCALVGQGLFVSYPLLDDQSAELRLLATERRRLGVEEVRLKNRLHSVLDLAWPEFGGYFAQLHFETPVALLERWPVPQDLVAAPRRSVRKVIKTVSQNHIAPERVAAIFTSAAATIAVPMGTAARRGEITRLLARWRLLREQLAEVAARLEALVEVIPAAKALTTLPAVSTLCAATLVGELGDPAWYQVPRQVLKLAGMNLVRKQSGTSVLGRVRQTKRGRPLLRRQLFLLAGRWCMKRGLYRDQYEALRRRGQSKTSAVCAIARKLVPLLLHIMHTREAFDAERWHGDRLTSPYRAA